MGIVVTIEEAQRRLPELLQKMREGESVVVTENGAPVARLAAPSAEPPAEAAPLDRFAKARQWLAERGIENPIPYVAPDFDDPLPEEFLIGEDGEAGVFPDVARKVP